MTDLEPKLTAEQREKWVTYVRFSPSDLVATVAARLDWLEAQHSNSEKETMNLVRLVQENNQRWKDAERDLTTARAELAERTNERDRARIGYNGMVEMRDAYEDSYEKMEHDRDALDGELATVRADLLETEASLKAALKRETRDNTAICELNTDLIRMNTNLIEARAALEQAHQERLRIAVALREWVMLYANVDHKDHDAQEVATFDLWLRACTLLGIDQKVKEQVKS